MLKQTTRFGAARDSSEVSVSEERNRGVTALSPHRATQRHSRAIALELTILQKPMSTKLSSSLDKLEALVLSAASRTTAKGDDASVVKVFTPAWDDNDTKKAEKFLHHSTHRQPTNGGGAGTDGGRRPHRADMATLGTRRIRLRRGEEGPDPLHPSAAADT